MAAWVVALFFVKFWRATRDRLFLCFFLAFLLLAFNWLGFGIGAIGRGKPAQADADAIGSFRAHHHWYFRQESAGAARRLKGQAVVAVDTGRPGIAFGTF